MEALNIAEAQSTPKVVLDKTYGRFEITGNSLPEDVLGFYAPIFNWIEEYIKIPNQHTEIHIKLNYFNSSSSKAILDILTMLEPIINTGRTVEVVWHYLDLDEDMLSTGKEFEEILKVRFTFVSYYQ
jgi:hypothetical protein